MILKKLFQKLGPDHLLILDIDSTLVQTHARNQAIIDDFCRETETLYPQDVAQIRKIQCQANDYGYYGALERKGVEFSSTDAKRALETFWKERFFSSDYLHHDPPVDGALDFLKALRQNLYPVVYLTGRYKDPMLPGTKASFDNIGFPYRDEELILKTRPEEPDHEYKSRVISVLKETFSKMTLIDNEPVILNSVQKNHPDVDVIWFQSTHSGRQAPPVGVPTITSFVLHSP